MVRIARLYRVCPNRAADADGLIICTAYRAYRLALWACSRCSSMRPAAETLTAGAGTMSLLVLGVPVVVVAAATVGRCN